MKKILLLVLIVAAVGAYLIWDKYDAVYIPNVETQEPISFYIHDDQPYDEVEQALLSLDILKDIDSFIWVAEQKSYPTLVKPGHYIIRDGMTNNELINMLRSGAQTPVKLSFNNVRNLPQLAGKFGSRLEADSIEFLQAITDEVLIRKYGFEQETFIAMFVPNTYEMYWTTSPEKLVERMASEFKRFWNEDRMARADRLGLSQSEVVTLASIVQAEQSLRPQEWPTIAGLYLNRIRRGMKLESDPTVIFAVGDFHIRRVLNKHLRIESPYNTYKVTGLPPGPIRMPDIAAVDAVLNADDHNYIFMCAKADLSGYHHFSETLRQHNNYARAYRRAMNDNRIYQ